MTKHRSGDSYIYGTTDRERSLDEFILCHDIIDARLFERNCKLEHVSRRPFHGARGALDSHVWTITWLNVSEEPARRCMMSVVTDAEKCERNAKRIANALVNRNL